MKAGGVTTEKLSDGAVTQTKLAAGVSLPPNGSAGGDLSGNYPSPVVNSIQGKPVSSVAPASGQVLKWNGISWAASADNTGSTVWQQNGNSVY